LYVWWQRNARQVITRTVRERAAAFVLNPDHLTVENAPVQMIGLREARVPKLVIAGNELQLRDGPTLAAAKLVVYDLDVSGPPFNFSRLNAGNFTVTVTDTAVTDFLRKRGVNIASVVRIPLDTLSVTFPPSGDVRLRGVVRLPIGKEVALTATGALVPAATPGKVDFMVKQVNVPLVGKQVAAALEKLNPIVDLTEWPVVCTVRTITSGKGTVTFTGAITGIRTRSLIP
ncbi:MAG TPA: hypothetical protein PK794_02625, partial [Armatimonadota bacterium]|nr:hypothetical protein [Armatimonadota bacterium]